MQIKIGESVLPIKYFSEKEFEKCSPSCVYTQMQPLFVHQLDKLREACGIKFILNSAYRSPEYEIAKGRTGKGFHTKGRAVDISCTDSATRMLIVSHARKFGLSCGVASKFIHLDNRNVSDGYPEPILYLY